MEERWGLRGVGTRKRIIRERKESSWDKGVISMFVKKTMSITEPLRQ
jgi:hypothetical protein